MATGRSPYYDYEMDCEPWEHRMTKTIKEVADGFCGSEEERLREIIRDALKECTSGDYVDRALRCQEVLENGLSEVSDG